MARVAARLIRRALAARSRVAVVALLTALLASSTSCSSSSAGITVAGSTSVQPFVEMLAEEYAIIHPETPINVQGGGSSAGIEAAISGAAQVGMSSRELKGSERTLVRVEIARDAIAVIVHPSNPLTNLSGDQMKGIFSGRIKRWVEVGGRDAPIFVVTREEGSGTRGAFQDLVLGKEFEVDPGSLVQDSNGAVRQLVASDPNSIGYVSLGLVNAQVKALMLDGVIASDDEVNAGRYKLVRPFLFVMREEPTGAAASFVQFVLSPTGQEGMIREGLLPAGGSQ